jgi:hypothetical protein
MIIKEFSERFPIGTKVKYFPIKGINGYVETEITSEPWVLGHGEAVVKIKDRRGGVCVSHLIKNDM